MMRVLLLVLLTLAACAPWPDVGGPTRAGNDDWPVLRPIDSLIEPGVAPSTTNANAGRLASRAAALRNRAAILRSDPSDMEVLRARLAR